ncbi:hypothetical protein LCGC14_1734490 [marine sediment metagenome]|uniref:Uncharacterized protein n=1 Tax=marine sediment metagenome TaxID=412755 RepID=A0A0F9JP03_9ZZZZ
MDAFTITIPQEWLLWVQANWVYLPWFVGTLLAIWGAKRTFVKLKVRKQEQRKVKQARESQAKTRRQEREKVEQEEKKAEMIRELGDFWVRLYKEIRENTRYPPFKESHKEDTSVNNEHTPVNPSGLWVKSKKGEFEPLSKEAKARYCESSDHCPYCESFNILGKEVNWNNYIQEVSCLSCQRKWSEVLETVDIIESG